MAISKKPALGVLAIATVTVSAFVVNGISSAEPTTEQTASTSTSVTATPTTSDQSAAPESESTLPSQTPGSASNTFLPPVASTTAIQPPITSSSASSTKTPAATDDVESIARAAIAAAMEVKLTPEVSAQRAAPSEAVEEKSMEGQRDLSQYFTGKALEQQMQNLANTVEAAKEGIFKQTAASNTVESIDKIDTESNEPFVRMTITTRSTIELLDPETETWNAESAETVRYANLTFERGDSGTLRVAKLVYDYPEASE